MSVNPLANNIFNNILVPYDDSRFSKKALAQAIGISKKFGSKLHIITVVNTSHVSPPGGLLGLVSSKTPLKKFQTNLKKAAKEAILRQVKRSKNTRDLKINHTVLSGNTSKKILLYAKQKKITIIVIGSQGLGGISKLKIMLGSTSRTISELASCPVLIIR